MKILITAGATQEPIDPVRYITNASSGRMGLSLAEEAEKRGHDITLIAGSMQVLIPGKFKTIKVRTAKEMTDAALLELKNNYDIFISTAAISDYTIVPEKDKIKSGEEELILKLTPTEKLTKLVKEKFPKVFVAAFKAEHGVPEEDLIEAAYRKLKKENLDLIIANDVSRDVFGSDSNEVFIVDKERRGIHIGRCLKKDVAGRIFDVVEKANAAEIFGKIARSGKSKAFEPGKYYEEEIEHRWEKIKYS
ncbi:hypothetical protein BEH94_06595 [Candidatus Altiarchaeales archaeon WOR_SM1_SCG]|nr:hypothetical protein BEH94_06595 [Candidatus Altiarchaeales archaeon WOR_SM1_SCG]